MRAPSLILCSNPRSGSTLLCDLLKATGVAGRPDSFYRRQSVPDYAEQFGLISYELTAPDAFEAAYLEGVIAEGSDASGRFALRLMAENRPELSAKLALLFPGLTGDRARFESAFGPCLFLHLPRQDKLAEAISLIRARQTGLWHRSADGSERERTAPPQPAVYDEEQIAETLAQLESFDAGWNTWFAAEAIEPLRLSYEALAADPQAELARILHALAENPAIAASAAPATSRLADAESADWAARFRAARGR